MRLQGRFLQHRRGVSAWPHLYAQGLISEKDQEQAAELRWDIGAVAPALPHACKQNAQQARLCPSNYRNLCGEAFEAARLAASLPATCQLLASNDGRDVARSDLTEAWEMGRPMLCLKETPRCYSEDPRNSTCDLNFLKSAQLSHECEHF